jgi:hypothetical protein
VGRYWEILKFEIYTVFGENNAAPSAPIATEAGVVPNGPSLANVAVFGRFVYRSRSIGKVTDSPFNVWAIVDVEVGKVVWTSGHD